jgi:uncharacterized protein involved in exopolysaccharide biosynthesis
MSINIKETEKYFEDEMSLKDVFLKIKSQINFLIKFKKLITLILIIFLFLGYVYYRFQTIKYKAEINFVLDDEKQSGITSAGAVASQLGIELGSSNNGIFSGDNLIYLFKSRIVIK